ncbi:zinc-ribbon domain-containing protein [Yinghuangia sp. ASG 101]|uniref:zinc-ribbon domain-containing protein n=1 Tax=Yinghuangia sp. ASG 101 TaxID=2896848 RepID=UPI001E3D9179|nr:zinc-ribbon domain-containing protein [Yinghuangia sp. ASG 101]UGQ11069.1 zinc-ribbon domain-containing protein [Yinghuangia sp. ASG 101]
MVLAMTQESRQLPPERRELLEREFVHNITHPERKFIDMSRRSVDICRWRCSTCGHSWDARFGWRNRVYNPTNCPECFKRRNRAPGAGEALTDIDPDLAKQFRKNLSRPDRSPDNLRSMSHDKCEWECPQGHLWTATVANRSNGRGCPKCSGHGRSLFECKVAMLVEAASGLDVELDHRLRLPGRNADRFDLFIPALSLLIDLDPQWSHHTAASLSRDTAKTRATLAAGRQYTKVRARGLPPIPIDGFPQHEAGPGVDPLAWADAVGLALRLYDVAWVALTPTDVDAALTKASRLWQAAVAGPDITALDVAPYLAEEFTGNITNPGRGLDRMPPGCNDVCGWRCLTCGCGHTWEGPLHSRTLSGRGCRKCGYRKTGADNSRPEPGKSLADVNRHLAAQLIEVIEHPGWTAHDLLPSSNKRCRWRCPAVDCTHEWIAPSSRRSGQSKDGGCPQCARKRTTAGRIRPQPGKSLLDRFPRIGNELVDIAAHPGWTAANLRPSSTITCTWKCSMPGCPGTWTATPDQRTRRAGTGTPCPVCRPPRNKRSGNPKLR